MAHCLLSPNSLYPVTRLITSRVVARKAPSNLHYRATRIRCCNQTVARRSGNYQPSIWDYDYLQSLSNNYVGEPYARQAEKLKGEVRMMLDKVLDPLDQLELIDVLQRLGISYHFEEEIERVLKSIYTNEEWKDEDLYGTSLKFRLLREHGFHVSQDVFCGFKDIIGNLNSHHCNDVKEMLGLYEASYHLKEGENKLDEAREYAIRHLSDSLKQNMDKDLAMEVSHALELPLHWRMKRLETRWFINVYERRRYMNPILLELAVLDFNMVQAIHCEDLQSMSRWWRHTRLGEKLSFSRDRLMENFFWTVGVIFEPQYGHCRRMSTKINALITTTDDIYDVYGTLDELEHFTEVVKRWDINSMEQLPDYMKICFLALFNSINEIAYDVLKEQDCNIIIYLKKSWADLCESYLLEAKWYHSGYIPTLDEYLNNAWISIAAPVILVHIYFFLTKPITKDALDCLERYSSVIRWSSMILRLANDLGTSSDELKRGDVPKSIQCYMYETGASEEDARRHIKNLIGETWKKMNEDRFSGHPFSQTFVGTAVNLARMAQCMYEHGDGHGASNTETKDRVLALLIEPIQVKFTGSC